MFSEFMVAAGALVQNFHAASKVETETDHHQIIARIGREEGSSGQE
jgi:hypothetical protein